MRGWRLVCLGLGCALGCTGPANTLTPGYEGAPGLKRFLVCAPNTVISLSAELQPATAMLRDQIDAYLRFHERESQTLGLLECRKLWTESMAAAKEQNALERTPAFFARKLDEVYDFDAIVMPSLIVTQARAMNGSARWDGVERQIGIAKGTSSDRTERRIRRDPMEKQVLSTRTSGEFPVTSVHVLVFSAAGERIFEGRGGIEFVQQVDLSNFARKHAVEFRLRDDLPGGIDAVREGVAIGFSPLLPMPEE
jgi:hypothetical protein